MRGAFIGCAIKYFLNIFFSDGEVPPAFRSRGGGTGVIKNKIFLAETERPFLLKIGRRTN